MLAGAHAGPPSLVSTTTPSAPLPTPSPCASRRVRRIHRAIVERHQPPPRPAVKEQGLVRADHDRRAIGCGSGPRDLAWENAGVLTQALQLLQGGHSVWSHGKREAVYRDGVVTALGHHEELLSGQDEDGLCVTSTVWEAHPQWLAGDRRSADARLHQPMHHQRVPLPVVVSDVREVEAASLRAPSCAQILGVEHRHAVQRHLAEYVPLCVHRPQHRGTGAVGMSPVEAGIAEAGGHPARLGQHVRECPGTFGYPTAGTRAAPHATPGQHQRGRGDHSGREGRDHAGYNLNCLKIRFSVSPSILPSNST